MALSNPPIIGNVQLQALQQGKIASLIDRNTASLLDIISSEQIIDVKLIDAGNALSGVFSFNGKLFNAQIPEDLYNEFILSSSTGNSSGINVKIQLDKVDGNSVTFQIVNELDNENIQKALDLYNTGYSENISANLKNILNGGLNLNTGNVSVSVKGNFLFIHFNFNTGLGNGVVILTADHIYDKESGDMKDGKAKDGKKSAGYSFMLEVNLEPLGYIKLFSNYFNNKLTVNFKNYTETAHKAINSNLSIMKDMLSSEGIILKEISFHNAHNSGNIPSAPSNNEFFSSNIINERI